MVNLPARNLDSGEFALLEKVPSHKILKKLI
jgi:hypothetical protein